MKVFARFAGVTMDKSEKRRLKKLGKELVEQRSADLQHALNQANSAPLGSDEWMENYRSSVQNEKWLREALPIMHKSEWESKFVVREDHTPGAVKRQKFEPAMAEDGSLVSSVSRLYVGDSTAESFVQCTSCESVVSMMRPPEWFYWKKCLCRNIKRRRILWWFVLKARDENQIRFVRLLGKGSAQSQMPEDGAPAG